MIIAGEYTFSLRSLAPAPLTRSRSFAIAAFLAWGVDMRHFHQLVLSLSHQGQAAAMMAWRSCGSPLGPFIGSSFGSCSRFASMFVVHCSFIP